MSTKKVIAVVGATGNQGFSVVKTYLSHPDYHVRALTRDTTSPAARSLSSLGAELIQADLSDKSSLEAAFHGATAIFVNTDFWRPYMAALKEGKSGDDARDVGLATERLHAKNAADVAAKVEGLEHFVYSALGPMEKASGGKYFHSYHWEGKAEAADYIESIPELSSKTSFIYPAVYHSNPFLIPRKDEQTGDYVMCLPCPATTRFPVILENEAMGPFVQALIETQPIGTKLFAYNVDVTTGEALEAWEKVTGKKTRFVQLGLDEMAKMTGLPYEILDGAAYLGEYDFMSGVKGRVIEAKDLSPRVDTRSYEDILRTKSEKELLEVPLPPF